MKELYPMLAVIIVMMFLLGNYPVVVLWISLALAVAQLIYSLFKRSK